MVASKNSVRQYDGQHITAKQLASLAAFLKKHATRLVDLNLSYNVSGQLPENRLDGFFQVKSLRRMKIFEIQDYRASQYLPSKIPACSNLELLFLNMNVTLDTIKSLLQVSVDDWEQILP